MYLEERMSIREVMRQCGIPDTKTVRSWVKIYQERGADGLQDQRGRTASPRRGRPITKPNSLEQENLRLRAENEYLKKLL
jgi:transposase-like protein